MGFGSQTTSQPCITAERPIGMSLSSRNDILN
jgi:hypothetical protein